MMRFLVDGLPMGATERAAHIEALEAALNEHEAKNRTPLFNHLYNSLSILDTKTDTLVAFNALLFAICSLLISPTFGESALAGPGYLALASIILSTVFTFVSAILLLNVIWVHWSPTTDLIQTACHIDNLLRIRNERTIRFRLAWWLTLFAMLLLGVHLALAGVHGFQGTTPVR